MIKRVLRSRGMRKFVKNRMAMVASAVILVYFVIAIAIFAGLLTRADAAERVLPNDQRGFLEPPDIEQRFDNVKWYVRDHLSNAFGVPGGLTSQENADRLLDGVALAERRVADLPPPELESMWRDLEAAFSALDDKWLEREDILYEIDDMRKVIEDMRDEGEDPEAIAEEQAYLDEIEEEARALDSQIAEGLDVVEAGLKELMPWPDGLAGLVYGFRTFLGSDHSGRSIAVQAFYSIKVAFQVGVVVGIISVTIGTILGSLGGFFGGWIDNAVMWLVSVISSVPYLIWLAVLSYLFVGHSLFDNPAEHPEFQLVKLYSAMCFAFWVSTARVIRGEVMKIKELEYVQAATAIGFGRLYIVAKHVIPNTAHLMFINFSLIFIGAIKSEVILTFLGLGVTGQPSWGVMISLGREDVQQFFFWTVLSATALMFLLVLAFNIVSDALQDAFDPKHV
jgi:peptide/nickel transport system permease protein